MNYVFIYSFQSSTRMTEFIDISEPNNSTSQIPNISNSPISNNSIFRNDLYNSSSCSSGESKTFPNVDAKPFVHNEKSVIVPTPTFAESNNIALKHVLIDFQDRNNADDCFRLDFPKEKTVWLIKKQMGEVFSIPVAQQEWLGWPANTTDSMKIGSVFPNTDAQNVPKLTIGKNPKVADRKQEVRGSVVNISQY